MPLLEVKNLSFEAEGRKILDGIELSMEKGEFLSVTGPSGSGKSTFLKIIATILSKTSGDVLYQGKPIESYNPTAYRKEVSYCFQSPVLFGETVRDNLAFPYEIRDLEFDERKAVEYLKMVGLSDAYLSKSINSLSGGEKQRVALIRNVLFQPSILLLDEVTSALDSENRQIIWQWLQEMREKTDMTILMISHNDKEAALADKHIRIVQGKITDKGGVTNGFAG